MDLFQYGGQTYLVAFDAYSNFPEVEHLTHTTTDAVVNALSAIFARHGLPIEVCSDNGPQFSSSDFKAFALKYDFRHVTSSPHFPSSNGLAEKGVQIVKRIMKKSEHAQEDYRLGLLNYRSSPLEDDGRSPSELLMGRRIRSRLPDFTGPAPNAVHKKQQSSRGRRPLQPLPPGKVVRLREKNSWETKAKVQDLVAPRSYQVITEAGRTLRRNRRHLLPTPEDFTPEGEDSKVDDYACLAPTTRPSFGDQPTGMDTASAAPGPTTRSPTPVPATVPPALMGVTVPPADSSRRTLRRVRHPPHRLTYDEAFRQQP